MHQGGVRLSRRLCKLKKAGIVVLGCSVDTADSHRDFIKQYHLPFALLVDPDKKIAEAYGVKNGIMSLGLDSRVTYVIKDGKIAGVYPKVDPAINASQIIHDFGSARPADRDEFARRSAWSVAILPHYTFLSNKKRLY